MEYNVINWLSGFLSTRGYSSNSIDKKPLFSYNVSAEEFISLERALINTPLSISKNNCNKYWAAGFCLFVAEWFRREYHQDWSWALPEGRLGQQFNSSQREVLVVKGLKQFWQRPIKRHKKGRDLLGSLFAEGGLPWQLVQSETHGFGRAIRKGLHYHYQTRTGLRSTASLLEDSLDYLPQAFRTNDTQQILAGIIDMLMYLVENYPLKGERDPALYLDQHKPDWKNAFPIPLDDSNARQLINEWLKDADQHQQHWKQKKELKGEFSCEHKLAGTELNWSITTELMLPVQIVISSLKDLSTTRLELGFYEGSHLIARGGAVYVQINDVGTMSIRFPKTDIELKRRDIRLPVSLRLLEYGRVVHSFYFESSDIDDIKAPMFFEQRIDDWYLITQGSGTTKNNAAKIRLPTRASVRSGKYSLLDTETCGARWLSIDNDLSITIDSDTYKFSVNGTDQALLQPSLTGALSFYNSQQHAVFMGFPTLKLPENYPYADELECYINGVVSSLSQQTTNKAGLFNICVKHKHGDVLLRRRVGVLPNGFSIALFPSSDGQVARIKICNGQGLLVQAVDSNVQLKEMVGDTDRWMSLEFQGDTAPTFLKLAVSHHRDIHPVTLIFPYPYQGARLFDEHGFLLKQRDMTINELLGVQLALYSGQRQQQVFHLRLELKHSSQGNNSDKQIRKAYHDYPVLVREDGQLLSLFSYHNDIVQLLSTVKNKNAYVRLTVESSQRLLTLDLRHYAGYASNVTEQSFAVCDMNNGQPRQPLTIRAMQLAAPEKPSVSISERAVPFKYQDDCNRIFSFSTPSNSKSSRKKANSQILVIRESSACETSLFNTSNLFDIPSVMSVNGPWLIYPASESGFQFQPFVYAAQHSSDITVTEPLETFYQAIQSYHSDNVIREQVTLMVNDFDHEGWQYLSVLKKNYDHLLLSEFKAWRTLARNSAALACAVFRLGLNAHFCYRISNELAVIWEEVSLSMWHDAYCYFTQWLESKGFASEIIEQIKTNRRDVLPAIIPELEHLSAFIANGDSQALPSVPIEVLPYWYQSLRQTHQSEDRWPDELGDQLYRWIKKQTLPREVQQLSQMSYTNSVVYLPIFMAFVTAGKTNLQSLGENIAYLKFVTKKVSDFDRSQWYTPVHSMMVAYLLKQSIH